MNSSVRSVWTGWASGVRPTTWPQMAAGDPFRLKVDCPDRTAGIRSSRWHPPSGERAPAGRLKRSLGTQEPQPPPHSGSRDPGARLPSSCQGDPAHSRSLSPRGLVPGVVVLVAIVE